MYLVNISGTISGVENDGCGSDIFVDGRWG